MKAPLREQGGSCLPLHKSPVGPTSTGMDHGIPPARVGGH